MECFSNVFISRSECPLVFGNDLFLIKISLYLDSSNLLDTTEYVMEVLQRSHRFEALAFVPRL